METIYGPEHIARAGLSRVVEPSTGLPDEVRFLPAIEQWAALRSLLDSRPAWRAKLDDANPERDLEAITRAGGRFVIPGDPAWPERLNVLDETTLEDRGASYRPTGVPYGLWVRGVGHLGEMTKRSVAIIGSRASSSYGEHVASELAAGLVDDGYTVVSGGAYGIDAAAHRGALARGGTTVAVLACGVDVAYPQRHEAMFARILDNGGVIVSEIPPGATPMRQRFLMRNRIVAALSQATVVVEAGQRSGAFNTVRWTEQIKHPVMAVPGPITATATSSGPNELIRTGRAKAVRSVADILEDLAEG